MEKGHEDTFTNNENFTSWLWWTLHNYVHLSTFISWLFVCKFYLNKKDRKKLKPSIFNPVYPRLGTTAIVKQTVLHLYMSRGSWSTSCIWNFLATTCHWRWTRYILIQLKEEGVTYLTLLFPKMNEVNCCNKMCNCLDKLDIRINLAEKYWRLVHEVLREK